MAQICISRYTSIANPVEPEYLSKSYVNEDAALIPPVSLVLDRLQLGLNWRDPAQISQKNNAKSPPSDSDYDIYFDAVKQRLESIAAYSPVIESKAPSIESVQPLKIRNDIIPPIFRAKDGFQEIDINLPPDTIFI